MSPRLPYIHVVSTGPLHEIGQELPVVWDKCAAVDRLNVPLVLTERFWSLPKVKDLSSKSDAANACSIAKLRLPGFV